MAITIFGTPVCPNCKTVTSYLSTNGVKYEYKNVGDDIQQSELEAITGRVVRGVPVIVADGVELTFDQLKTRVTSDTLRSEVRGLEL